MRNYDENNDDEAASTNMKLRLNVICQTQLVSSPITI